MRLAFLFLFIPFLASSQEDSAVFTQDHLIWYVKNYHPVSVQGRLLLQRGENEVKQARGGFDPYLYASYEDKYYDDKNYFNLLNAGLKVPTWYGIELKTGIDQNDGVFLNPENNVPDGGLWFGGVSVALGSGLFIDDRRASLRQAQIFAESTYAEQQQLMNDLYFDAIKSYWKWVEAWNSLKVYEAAVELAQFRFEGVRQSYIVGDLPAIDTLEAKIQVQNRTISFNESTLEFQNATLELSNYLWFENNTPLELTDSISPPSYENIELSPLMPLDSLERIYSTLKLNHPEMQLFDFKLSQLNIDRRLKAEQLKPKLNLKPKNVMLHIKSVDPQRKKKVINPPSPNMSKRSEKSDTWTVAQLEAIFDLELGSWILPKYGPLNPIVVDDRSTEEFKMNLAGTCKVVSRCKTALVRLVKCSAESFDDSEINVRNITHQVNNWMVGLSNFLKDLLSSTDIFIPKDLKKNIKATQIVIDKWTEKLYPKWLEKWEESSDEESDESD